MSRVSAINFTKGEFIYDLGIKNTYIYVIDAIVNRMVTTRKRIAMGRIKKLLYLILILINALVVIVNTWPFIIDRINGWLSYLNIDFEIESKFLVYSSIFILFINLVLFLVIIFFPKQRKGVILSNELGELVISNESIISYVKTSLGEKNFTDVSVKIKNWRNKVTINVEAKTNFFQKEFSNLEDSRLALQKQVTDLLASKKKIAVKLKINRKSKNTSHKSRVV